MILTCWALERNIHHRFQSPILKRIKREPSILREEIAPGHVAESENLRDISAQNIGPGCVYLSRQRQQTSVCSLKF